MTDPQNKVVDLAAQVEERLRQEAAELAAAEPKKDEAPPATGGPDDPRFIMRCLANNERGDGILFTALQRDQYVYNKTNGLWYQWEGHHWSIDKLNRAQQPSRALRSNISTRRQNSGRRSTHCLPTWPPRKKKPKIVARPRTNPGPERPRH
ncbi:hypothetical protein [Syntrophotalea acetylenica]|uniref:hypothetical protein n=1 Tax=Syntrophotalea acetylenica TaxID=29542 RepID=UPI00090BEAD1|nr:hypothetical protein [Syntrophotalea acetylenica]APG45461.1 hypothetical protein A6070_14875 [Syntrophotalea acetylenica]